MTAEGQKRAAVETVEPRGGKLQDVNVISFKHNFLAWTVVHCDRRQRLADSPIPLAVNFLLLALHRQGVPFARGQCVYKNRNIFAAGALK